MNVGLEEFMTMAEPPKTEEAVPTKDVLSFDEFMGVAPGTAAETAPVAATEPWDRDHDAPGYIERTFQSFASGMARLNADASRIPAALYTAGAIPQNALARVTGWNVGAKAPDWMLDNPISRHFDSASEAYNYRKKAYPDKDLVGLMGEGKFAEAGDYLLQSVIENAPQMLAQVGGSIAGVPQWKLLSFVGSQQAAGTYAQAREKGLDELEAATAGIVHGGFEAVFEKAGTFGLLEWGKDLYKDVGQQTGMGIVKNTFKYILGSSLGEGTEELWTQLAQDFTNKVYGIEDVPWKDFPRRAVEAATIGAVSGATMVAPGGIAKGLKVNAETRDQQRADAIQQQLEAQAKATEEAETRLNAQVLAKTPATPEAIENPLKPEPTEPKEIFTLKPDIAAQQEGRKQEANPTGRAESRRAIVRSARDAYGLTDGDLKSISREDIRLMSEPEFGRFLDEIDAKAAVIQQKRDLKLSILSEIHEKELVKTENLRKYFQFPKLDEMTVEQLNDFNQALEAAQKGDEFLSVRRLETVKNTDLAGIKTVREAKEILAKKMGVPVEKLGNVPVGPLDKFRFDTALAEKDPFYKFLVDETNASLLEGEDLFIAMENEVDELTSKARASRSRSLLEKAIPTDELVFEWLESPSSKKKTLAEKMTDEEIALANALQTRFAWFRDYLIQQGALTKYRDDYITHIRRGFLETWKDDGLLNAFKSVFAEYMEDAAVFKILDDDTQNILPLEKFFQFSMQRSGALTPSKNVAKAYKAYTKAMTKKMALDKIVPALDTYAYALSPKQVTPRGLQMNRDLIKFVREWVNNKKGRRSSLGGVLPQGGAVDIGLRAINSFVTMVDLGFNIPVGISSAVGEQVVSFVGLGSAQYAKGIIRSNTVKGKKVVEENRDIVGKSPWRDLSDTANDIGDLFSKGLFSLFAVMTEKTNKIHLLGSMTDAEWEAGEIDFNRKAEIIREMGRWRAVSGSSSIVGSTSFGKTLTKYKSWAIPVLRTVVNDLEKVSKMAAKGDFADVAKSREFQELFRATLVTAFLAIAVRAMVDDDDGDDSFTGTLVKKASRESLTIIGAIDPTVMTSVRGLSFAADLATAIKQIVTLEEYKSKPGYKGVQKLRNTLTPRIVKSLFPEKRKRQGL